MNILEGFDVVFQILIVIYTAQIMLLKYLGELTDIQGVSKKKKPKFKFYLREDYRNVG